MSRLTFGEVEDLAVEIANTVLGDISTKNQVKDCIMDMIAWSCMTYENDEDFRRNINAYHNYRMTHSR